MFVGSRRFIEASKEGEWEAWIGGASSRDNEREYVDWETGREYYELRQVQVGI